MLITNNPQKNELPISTAPASPTSRSSIVWLREEFSRFDRAQRPLADQEKTLQDLARSADAELNASSIAACGNKYGNLIKIGRVVNPLLQKDFHIPMPEGLSTEVILTFWQKRSPSILTYWQQLKELHTSKQKEQTPVLEHPETTALLGKINTAIAEVFTQYADEVPLPEHWLQSATHLMVRSSGAEDSHKSANAGGNKSLAYIAPTRKALCPAIAEVIQSYFSHNSLQNRLNAGVNPFEEELSLGVVLQELIGEQVGGATDPKEIPISFVLFTNEPLFIGNEPFRVMQLSATYGHGEAVVGTQGIATDSALLLHSVARPDEVYILYTNQRKLERLAPLSSDPIVLGALANPTELAEQPALSHAQLLSIYRDAILVEGIFNGHPTDIEGVVKNGVVHFVQARPVNRQPMLPTYLRSQEAVLSTLYAETVVSANASILAITDSSEILLAETLEEAEHRFHLASRPPKLIIVRQRPSATSHPVVNFRGLHMPCICVADSSARDRLLQQIDSEHSLAVCMQTGTLNLWDNSRSSLERAIAPGFAVHPASIAASLPIAPRLAKPRYPTSADATEFKEALRSSNWEFIETKLKELSKRKDELQTRAKTLNPIPLSIQQHIEALRVLKQSIKRALDEVRASSTDSKQLRLRSLFYLKTLEAQLIGSPTDTRALGQYSLLEAEEILHNTASLLDYQSELSHPAHCLELVLYGSNTSQEWKQFLLRLEPLIEQGTISPDQVHQFREFIQTLLETGVFPFWLTFFQPSNQLSPLQQFETVLQQVDDSGQMLARSLHDIQKSIESKTSQLSRFSDPKNFPHAWDELKQNVTLWSSSSWLESIQNASPIVQAIAYHTMAKAVDLLDRSIKEMKSSQNSSELARAACFKIMLEPYHELMKAWIALIPTSELTKLLPSTYSLRNYLDVIKDCFQRPPQNSVLELAPSRDFSVSAAMLGSTALITRHTPKTLEDLLTLLHQNSLVALTVLNQKLFTQEQLLASKLPAPIHAIMKQLEQTSWGLTAQRIGLSISEETITLHYNVPLNNHSGRINLYYDIPSKTLVFQGQFLGEARERWGEIAAWIKALEQAGLFSAPKTLLQTDQELTFHWNMTPEHLPAALKEYAEMGEWSYVFPGDLIPFFQRQWARWKTLPEKKLLLQAFSQAPTDFVAGLCEAMLSSDFDSSDRSVIETIIKTWKKSSYWKQQQAAQSLEKHPSLKYMAPAPNLPSQMST